MYLTLYYRIRGAPEQVFVARNPEVFIGRLSEKGIDVDLSADSLVSSRHARLVFQHGGWWIEDLGSKYGTSLNGSPVGMPTPLSPNDRLRIGDTEVRLEFEKLKIDAESHTDGGRLEQRITLDETQPPASVSEDRRLEVLARISQIAAHTEGQALLDGVLRELATAFPQSERRSVLLVEDSDVIPRAFYPPGQSHVSFTLARRAIAAHQALSWTRTDSPADHSILSLDETSAALYAPLLCRGRAIGVLHVDTTKSGVAFSETDLQLLGVIANTVGPAIRASSNPLPRYPGVYISYAPEDRPAVDRLAADLRRRRIKVWYDERIRLGVLWREHIAAAIRSADACVPFLSVQAVESEQVRWEVGKALEIGKPMYAVVSGDFPLPGYLAAVSRVTLEAGDRQSLFLLANELHELIERPKGSTPKEDNPVRIRILFLAANPRVTDALRLSEEVRTIDEQLRMSEFRSRFELVQHWALRHSDVAEALLRHAPHIVHFSGHATQEGAIILENTSGDAHLVSPKTLTRVFRALKDRVRCVVLNACWSAKQAEAIVREIDCVVGMSRAIGDAPAIAFSAGFYRALGYGRSVETAFALGCAEIDLANLGHEATPQLFIRHGSDSTRLHLI